VSVQRNCTGMKTKTVYRRVMGHMGQLFDGSRGRDHGSKTWLIVSSEPMTRNDCTGWLLQQLITAIGCNSRLQSLHRVFAVYTVLVKKSSLSFCGLFTKQLRFFRPNPIRILRVSVYARLQIFVQLSATLTKLCHIKRHHPVHIVCAKCPPSVERQADIFWHFFPK